MGPAQGLKPPRIVLDTNCVVSALIFSRGRLAWLRDAWQSARIIPLASRATAEELITVLSYPKFALSRAEQETLLADFLLYAETVDIARSATPPRALRDPDDAVFFALARRAKADALVSGDNDVLALRGKSGSLRVLAPAEFRDWLETSGFI